VINVQVDLRILVDDRSTDETLQIANRLGLQVFVHERNYGYGRNQQTCYREALAAGADIVVMVHPDYQYTPLLVTAMASMNPIDRDLMRQAASRVVAMVRENAAMRCSGR
jgi:glycosyltransferase involved in cell wall biosynthesis